MSFRRRSFPEVLDHLLTDLVGGIAAEAHPVPLTSGAHPLEHRLERPPAAEITSLWGSRDGRPHRFRLDSDYELLSDRQTIAWKAGGVHPDPGTLVQINYLPESALPIELDLQTGSIIRTLAESIGLEIARLYAQLEVVHRAGFIDTAQGDSLDRVVALLGVDRIRGGRAMGEIEFTRAGSTPGAITIPSGTRILTPTGEVEYETVETITLAPGQRKIRALARDLESNAPLPAGALTVLAMPLAGIAGVTNPAPTAIARREESDGELRSRAKNFLHGSERATLGALREAIARQQITADVVEDPARPGRITITPHTDVLSPELEQRLRAAIQDTRPAGVIVELLGPKPPKRIDIELRLQSAPGLPASELRAAQRAVRERVEEYIERLPVGGDGSINQLVGLILGVPGIEDVRIVEIRFQGEDRSLLDPATGTIRLSDHPTRLGMLQIADPQLPTALDLVLPFPASAAPPSEGEIRDALAGMIAHLDELNSTGSAADPAQRTLSFGTLLQVLPLPGKPGHALGTAPGTIPLPDLAAIAPYRPRFALTLESGSAQILAADGDEYRLTPFERLSLAGITLVPEGAE